MATGERKEGMADNPGFVETVFERATAIAKSRFPDGCASGVILGGIVREAIAMEAAKPSRHEVGSTRKGDSAGRRHRPDTGMTQGEEKGR